MLDLLHKKCKLGGYVRGQMPKNANVICEGSLMIPGGQGYKLSCCGSFSFIQIDFGIAVMC